MIPQDLSPARLQAFSDGVIAVIITLMVLELKVPAGASYGDFLKLWPNFAIYALSYLLVAIYWMNHHHLLSMVRRVSIAMLWTNIALLFFLSLVPFCTAYVGQTRAASFPVLCYAVDMLASGSCFMLLAATIAAGHFRGDAEAEAAHRSARQKNLLAMGLYCVAGLCAYYKPQVSMGLILIVACMYLVPGSWVKPRD
jgi:uncharacterized membrane protein